MRTVLIANRGEIAVRILRTLHKEGLRGVVVHHEADAASLAVRLADDAVELHGSPPVSAYLDIDQIVAAAGSSGADAVHPGFGFLAENGDFAQAVIDAGLTWIGPPPDAIRSMGDKIEAKRLAEDAGVPILPGSPGALADVDDAVEWAERIGYPVLLKASAGGGGKGMRIAHDRQECVEAFTSASNEARASFGDGRVFVERFVERPRHVEVQLLADQHGAAVHLGERECSIQRRYQKVVEEAPSPVVDEEARARIGAQAVALAQAVGYASAGTVELVMDERGEAYFLEMNTRLQVEHPVTELVTGIDIVAEQLRIARGEPLGYDQDAVTITGSAIECRVYAEDADADFAPETGTLHLVHFPSGEGVRVDHGVQSGQVVGAAFDPMIAKVVGFGADRTAAIAAVRKALRETVLLGLTTNTAYLERIVGHPEFVAGATHTGFLALHEDDLRTPPLEVDEERALICAAALASPWFDPRHAISPVHAALGGWRA